ncbi:hypothetical protein ACFLSY_06790 [Bacteroidota bacterium]
MNNPYAIYVFCDGAMDYNSENSGGIGYLITFPETIELEDIFISKGIFVRSSIERIELEAMIEGMEATIDVVKEYNEMIRGTSIIFVTDRYPLREDDRTNPYKIKNWRKISRCNSY